MSADMLRITSVIGIGLAEDQNQRFRKTMEDSTVMIDKYGNNLNLGFFAVFDGHGGADAAKSASELVHRLLIEEVLHPSSDDANVETYLHQQKTNLLSSVASPKFGDGESIDFDKVDYDKILRRTIARTDDLMKQRGHIYVGCTACICIVSQKNFTLANVGDSRAVLCSAGIATRMTKDHKASDLEEQKRIKEAGGAIVMGRVNGFISVSRALGDHCIKQLVTGDCDVFRYERTEKDEFIIIACDGIWDVISDEQAIQIVRKTLKDTGSPQRAAGELKNAALRGGTQDNISVLLLVLKDPYSIF